MRVNARFSGEYEERIQYLMEKEQEGVTAVLKKAVDVYYERVKSEQEDGRRALLRSGFVGCADGDAALSSNYKDTLGEGLDDKW